MNGKAAFVYYISPTQVNVLTPPDSLPGPAPVVVSNNGAVSTAYTAQAQPTSPSFFVFGGGPYVAATHANGSLLGPTALYPGATTPAAPGETIVLLRQRVRPDHEFGGERIGIAIRNSVATAHGQIGGINAAVIFAGLVSPGEFQFNVVVPSTAGNGDQAVVASYNGASTQPGALISILHE
jgi:uncharacterized protein (TIGR03437 family)